MKIAVGLSGGVDSSVAALLLKEQGHDVVGITMKLWRGQYKGGAREACFGANEENNIAAAAKFAEQLGIEHRVFDCSEEYDSTIVSYFRDTYLSGQTPNPCVFCNPIMKFGLLPRLAKENGLEFEAFATGHYARIIRRASRWAISRALDIAKDQSYFLYRLEQTQLEHLLFPLGELTKKEVRELAHKYSLCAADRPDSQDFYSGDTNELIGEPDRPGNVVDSTGRVLAKHTGFWHYTIGQRKGLGIGGAGEPYYVIDLNACRNEVVVGRASEAVSTSLKITDVNWVAESPTSEPVECLVKVRSAGRLVPATLTGNSALFPDGIQGVAPGQSAVFYAPETQDIICGGIICR